MVLLKDCFLIIIHLEKSNDRLKYINNIIPNFNSYKIINAIDGNTLDIDYWYNMKNFKRMPSLKKSHLLGRVGCFLSHLEAYKYIIDNKLNNIIILEDDININDDNYYNINLPENYDMIYLDYMIWNSKTKQNRISYTDAIYYKNYNVVNNIYDDIYKLRNKWKSIDWFLDDYIVSQKNKYNVLLHNPKIFSQNSKKNVISLIK